MRVLVAMSGGVDSSVAAALLVQAGEEVVGVTMKLWGGPSDSGCCSVSDVDDARRVAQQLGIAHHVFNFSEEFDRHVVEPYVAQHAAGHTPNPCVECNRHLKFDRLLVRAAQLGFDAVATGHHAQVGIGPAGTWVLRRGADSAKDQSYVLHMLTQDQLARVRFPVGHLLKSDVRQVAAQLGLRTAAKPDSQDVCFISKSGGREAFLGERIGMHPAKVIDGSGTVVGHVPSVHLVTVGQRKHLGAPTVAGAQGMSSNTAERTYAVDVDVPGATVTVGPLEQLLCRRIEVRDPVWSDEPPADGEDLEVQLSAHGRPAAATWTVDGAVLVESPVRRVAPGQSVVLYRGDAVVGGGVAV